jgi:hypothetical protein
MVYPTVVYCEKSSSASTCLPACGKFFCAVLFTVGNLPVLCVTHCEKFRWAVFTVRNQTMLCGLL